MRINPLSERAENFLIAPIAIPLAIVIVPAVLVALAINWPYSRWRHWLWTRREARGAHPWFAWRPVKLDGFYYDRKDAFVWLEQVDRRVIGGDAWAYRFPGELDRWERRDAARALPAAEGEK